MRRFGLLTDALVAALYCLVPSAVIAQSKDAKANAPKLIAPKDSEAATKPVAKPAAAKSAPASSTANAASAAPAKNANRSEHIVYVPYSKLAEVFEKDARNVLMPFAEYQQLWDAVRRIGSSSTKPPLPAVLSSVEYVGRIEGELARLRAKLVVDVLSDDWLKLPFALRGAAIANVEGGMFAAASTDGYWLLLKNRGRHVVSFDAVVPVLRSAEGRQIALDGPVAGGTTLELTVPETKIDFEVVPKPAAPLVEPKANATTLRASLGAVESLRVAWRAKTERTVMAPLAVARSVVRVDMSEGVVRTDSRIEYQILRGQLSQLALSLPTAERLLDVQAPGLRDWKISGEGAARRVDVRLHAPAERSIVLRVESERTPIAGKFAIGEVRPLEVDRQSGVIALLSSDEANLAAVERKGLTRVAPTEAPTELQRPNGLYYKFYTGDYSAMGEATPVLPRVAATQHVVVRLDEGRVRMDARIAYDVQRAGIYAVRIRMPAGLELEELAGAEIERHEALADPAGAVVVAQLKQRTVGGFELQIKASALRPEAAATNPLRLPIPQPLETNSERGFVALLAHESFEVVSDAAKLVGLRAVTPADLAAAGFALRPEPRTTLAASYRYLTRPVEGVFEVRRRKTRIVADTFTRFHLRENAVVARAILAFNVQYAGTESLEVLVPDAIADNVEIAGANVKEKRRGKSVDGHTPWTILLHSRALGRHALVANYEEPLKLGGSGVGKTEYSAKLIRAGSVERENGQIAVVKERALSLEDKVENLEPIDPRQLQMPSESAASDAREAAEVQLAYRYYRHPNKLTVAVAKHEIQRVVETVITRTLIDSVVPESGPITHRVLFSAKSSQRQRLRLKFPAGVRILGVQVAGRTAQPEKDPKATGEEYLINVGRSTGIDEVFPISVVFEQPRPTEKLSTTTFLPIGLPKLEFSAPTFVGDVSQQRLHWRAWLPNRYTVVGVPDGFADEGPPHRPLLYGPGVEAPYNPEVERWLQDWGQVNPQSVFEFAAVGKKFGFSSAVGNERMELRYGHVPAMVAAASLGLLFLMVATIRLRFERKLTLLLLVATGLAIGGLFRPDEVFRWLAASGIGLAAGSVLWIGDDILRARREQNDRRRAHFEKMSILQHQEQHLSQLAQRSEGNPSTGDVAASVSSEGP